MPPPMKEPYLIFAAPFLVSAVPPLDAETKREVRCFVALMISADVENSNRDKPVAEAMLVGAHYYLGRLDGRVPALDLEEAVAAEVETSRAETNGEIIHSCIKAMLPRLKEVEAIGKRLEKRGI